jgi:predicted glutamine amidotransferase
MCLIVHKYAKDSVFTLQQFDTMINCNRDGLGIMYVDSGRVRVEKSVGSDKEKRELWMKHRDRNHYVMHARLATHGAKDVENCHPYEILNMDKGDPVDLWMVHNGVINGIKDVDTKMSDTWNFVNGVIKPIVKADIRALWQSEHLQYFIDRGIGASKLVFLTNKALKHNEKDKAAYYSLTINGNAGEVVNGCWLSNLHSVGMYKSTHYHGGKSTETISYYQNKREDKSKKEEKAEYTSWWDKFRNPYLSSQETDEVPANDEKTQAEKDDEAQTELLEKLSDTNKQLNEKAKKEVDKTFPTRNKSIVLVADKTKVVDKARVAGDLCTVAFMPENEKDKYALMLQTYKQCKDPDIEDLVREVPEDAASIIFYFAPTLGEHSYNDLVKMCSDPKQSKDVVNMIRHCDIKNAA